MDDCVAASSLDNVQKIVDQVQLYQRDPGSFHFDKEKALREKEALAKKKHEEGKRKRFEDRMIRKAKREGKDNLEFYWIDSLALTMSSKNSDNWIRGCISRILDYKYFVREA